MNEPKPNGVAIVVAAGPSQRRAIRSRFAVLTVAIMVALGVAAGCGASESGSGGSGERDTDSLTVGVTDINVPFASLFWAAAKGYFKTEGLELNIKVGQAGTPAQLVAGQTDVYMGSQGALFGITNSGKPVKTIYGMDSGLQAWVVASKKSVTTPADCKTLTSAIPGTILYAWAKQLENVFDVKWNLAQMTTASAITANIAAGRTDCANGNISFFLKAIEEGKVRVILDPTDKSELPSNWPVLGVEDVIGGLPDTLEEKRPAVEKFVKAYGTAVRDYMKADPHEIARTLIASDSNWAAVGSEDVLANAVETLRPLLNPNAGYVSEDLWSRTVSFFEKGGLAFLGNDASKYGYGQAVDMSYYKAAGLENDD